MQMQISEVYSLHLKKMCCLFFPVPNLTYTKSERMFLLFETVIKPKVTQTLFILDKSPPLYLNYSNLTFYVHT